MSKQILQKFKITYVYQHEETGCMLKRVFSLAEIKDGEDDAHLAIIPNYFLVDIIKENEQ